jgi:hypothetical protein
MFGLFEKPQSEKLDTHKDYADLPHNPELNPPDSINELEELINKLLDKSESIKSYMAFLEQKSTHGQGIDLMSYNKSSVARKKTNISIAALQRILKKKKLESPLYRENYLANLFLEEARDKLSPDQFLELMQAAKAKLKDYEA